MPLGDKALRHGCECRCCDHSEGSDCACNCHAEGKCAAALAGRPRTPCSKCGGMGFTTHDIIVGGTEVPALKGDQGKPDPVAVSSLAVSSSPGSDSGNSSHGALAGRPEPPQSLDEKVLQGVETYIDWHGAVHDDDCPQDDTCSCSWKWVNDSVNAAVRYLRAALRAGRPEGTPPDQRQDTLNAWRGGRASGPRNPQESK